MNMKEYFPKNELFEKLAAIEHERWVDWQRYCLEEIDRFIIDPTSGLIDRVENWKDQFCSYNELCEQDKDKDREQVMRYWHLIIK